MPDDLLNGQNSQTEGKSPDSGADLGDKSEQSPLEEAMTKMPEENPVDQVAPQNPPPASADSIMSSAEPTPAQDTPPKPEPPVEPLPSAEPTPAQDTPPEPEPPVAPFPPASDTSNTEPVAPQAPDFNPPANEPVAPTPSETPAPADEQETAKAPDTDEFLKSILNDQPQDAVSATPDQTTPEPNFNADQPTGEPSGFEPTLTTPATLEPAVPEESPVNLSSETSQPGGPAPAPGMQDAGNIDGISHANVPPLPVPEAPQPELSPDSIQAPKPSGSPARLIILIVVAAILVIGGYLAYTLLFASNSTTTTTQKTVTTTPNSSNDQVRKTDLIKIQQALLNYFAGTGKYPVAATMIYLNAANNVVGKALVPAYLSALPTDPDSPDKNYAYKSDGKTFSLTAVLDNTTDPEGVAEGSVTLYKVTEATKASATSTVSASVTASTAKTVNSEASVSATPGI